MEIVEILAELRAERARYDKAIKALEALQSSRRDSGRNAAKRKKLSSAHSSRALNPIPTKARNLAEVIPIRQYGS